MIGQLLRAQDQAVTIALEVLPQRAATLLGDRDGGAGGEIELAGIQQIEGGILQHLRVHGQVLEGPFLQATHHRVGHAADARLQRQQCRCQTPQRDFLLEQFDQMARHALGAVIRRRAGRGAVTAARQHDGGDSGGIHRDIRRADARVRRDHWNRLPAGAHLRNVDVVQPFKRRRRLEIELDDHLVGENRIAGRVAHRGGRHDAAIGSDGAGLDHRDVHVAQLVIAQQLHRLGQVLVHEHDFAGIDGPAQHRVDLKRHAPRQHVGIRHLAVEVIAQRGAGHQRDGERLAARLLDQRQRQSLGLPRPREATHAHRHAIVNQFGGLAGAHLARLPVRPAAATRDLGVLLRGQLADLHARQQREDLA